MVVLTLCVEAIDNCLFKSSTILKFLFIVEPGQPSIPTVSDITADSMTLSWHPPSDDGGSPVISYTIEKREKFGKWVKANRQPVTDTTFTLSGLTEGTEYEFRVCAENKAGPGKFSDATMPKLAKNPYGE